MSTSRHPNIDAPRVARDAEALPETMIDTLREIGAVRSDRVAEVFRAVPRHLFAPGAPLEAACDPRDAVHVKWDDQGVPISTASSPQLQGSMLEQTDIRTARPARWNAMTARRPEGAPAVRPVNGPLVGQHGPPRGEIDRSINRWIHPLPALPEAYRGRPLTAGRPNREDIS